MPESPVFYNRYTQALEEESVYGDAWLRFIYGNPLGKVALHALVKRAFFSKWFGWRMDQAASKAKISGFIEQYQIPVEEMLSAPESYEHFNAFFARKLKPEARPIHPDVHSIILPADARHLLVPDVSTAKDLFIKGQGFDLKALLADAGLAEVFEGGAAVISRLCPVDYHRFHFPVSGYAHAPIKIAGNYFSVNPLALARIPGVLWKNKRELTVIDTEHCGKVVFIEVGATCVGSITQTYTPNQVVEKGDEKGFFTFGGSTVMTLFEANRVRFADDLEEQAAHNRELYARMGDVLGFVC